MTKSSTILKYTHNIQFAGAIKIDDLYYCKVNKIRSLGLADSYNLWSFRISEN